MVLENKDTRLIPYGSTNLGTPLHLVNGLIVPNDRFFVRSNGPTPLISRDTWQLSIAGLVARPQAIDFPQLRKLPKIEMTAFLECTGNSRSRFSPEAEGTPWQNDAVGNASWGGVLLRDILELAGIRPGAVDVVSQGADLAEMRRGLSVAIALHGSAMLAFEMNGEPLPAAHGGPIRLIVPGWSGIASTKWLIGLDVADRPFVGPYQGDLYTIQDRDGAFLAPIREMPVKSIIAWPSSSMQLDPGAHVVWGFAWSGYAPIDRVELSADGGDSWLPATIVERAGPFSWVRWEYEHHFSPGSTTLMARATDERAITQPKTAQWNAKGYLMNAIHSVEVHAGDAPAST
jgi:DMSO/TMAO reductase YedYZ molybdopterin-dependent catalytic subunit